MHRHLHTFPTRLSSCLSTVTEEDGHAIAHYFADVDHAAEREKHDKAALARAMEQSKIDLVGPTVDPDAKLYQGACAACHYNAAPSPVLGRPDLALNNALWLDEPTNLYQVILHGLTAEEGQTGVAMPSFYNALSDQDMARIAAYLRRTRTDRKSVGSGQRVSLGGRRIIH